MLICPLLGRLAAVPNALQFLIIFLTSQNDAHKIAILTLMVSKSFFSSFLLGTVAKNLNATDLQTAKTFIEVVAFADDVFD